MSQFYKNLLGNYKIVDLSQYPEMDQGEKGRYLLESHEDYELVLMVWGAGHETPIHDHHKSHCWTKLLQGSLTERIYDKDCRLLSENHLEKNCVNYIQEKIGVHQILNLGKSEAITIHLYSNPLKTFHLFDDQTQTWIEQINEYDLIPKELL